MAHLPLPIDRVYLSQSISEPCFGETENIFYYLKTANGRKQIIRQEANSGFLESISTEPFPSAGVGYGSGVFAVAKDTLVYATREGRLLSIDLKTGEQSQITPRFEGVAAPEISSCGRFVAFIAEQDSACNVFLVDIQGKKFPVKLSQDPWYAFNPVFSPDGNWLAWQEWSAHAMPWDESYLRIAHFSSSVHTSNTVREIEIDAHYTLAKPGVSFASPQFSPNSKSLAFTSDMNGWRSLYVSRSDGGGAVRIETGPGEIGDPGWVPGQFAMRWNQQGDAIYTVRRYQSRDFLLRISWPDQVFQQIETHWTEIDALAVQNHHLIFIGSAPDKPNTLITYDVKHTKETRRATTAIGIIPSASLSIPKVISWHTQDGIKVWGIFYRAFGKELKGPKPLLVFIHGGPTSEKNLSWEPQAQYFATRGWHCLYLNHRGSSGFGREYQDLLHGQWGVFDVEDARGGAEQLIQSGEADPRRVVISGGSAGGYTTLMALTQHSDFWSAGIALYGIGDLYALKQGSHRFEVNYEDILIGKLPEKGLLWKKRSPLTHAKQVKAPVLLFHGKEDKAVPYEQSVQFAEAVKRQGKIAELILYDDEGHGFRREKNRRNMLESMEAFLNKYILCYQV